LILVVSSQYPSGQSNEQQRNVGRLRGPQTKPAFVGDAQVAEVGPVWRLRLKKLFSRTLPKFPV
jgi:hypothetical protein